MTVLNKENFQFGSFQLFSRVWIFATPWTAALQATLSITNSQSLLKLMSNGSVIPSNHLTLCHPLLLPPSIFPSIRVFSNESTLHIRWPKYWSFSFSMSPSNEYSGLISFRISNSHVWMWELDYKESWVPKNWCFWTVVLEKTLEKPSNQGTLKSLLQYHSSKSSRKLWASWILRSHFMDLKMMKNSAY